MNRPKLVTQDDARRKKSPLSGVITQAPSCYTGRNKITKGGRAPAFCCPRSLLLRPQIAKPLDAAKVPAIARGLAQRLTDASPYPTIIDGCLGSLFAVAAQAR